MRKAGKQKMKHGRAKTGQEQALAENGEMEKEKTMKKLGLELKEIYSKKGILILTIYAAAMAVLAGFSGPTAAVTKIFGAHRGMAPFAAVHTISMPLSLVLALMVTLSMADSFKLPKTYTDGGMIRPLAVRWAAGLLLAAGCFLLCFLPWLIRSDRIFTLKGSIPRYGVKITVFFLAAVLLLVCHVTCCYMVSLLTKDLIAATLVCVAVTLEFAILGASGSSAAVFWPTGALVHMAGRAAGDEILSASFFGELAPPAGVTAALCVLGGIVYGRRKNRFRN